MRHNKIRGSLSLILKCANIQLAGSYLADNHIRAPVAFTVYLRLANLTEVSVPPNHRFVNPQI